MDPGEAYPDESKKTCPDPTPKRTGYGIDLTIFTLFHFSTLNNQNSFFSNFLLLFSYFDITDLKIVNIKFHDI